MDAGREERAVPVDALELLQLRPQAVRGAARRRLPHRVSPPHCGRRLALPGWVAHRLRAPSAVAARLETLPGRSDDADLGGGPEGFAHRKGAAGEFERLQSHVGGRHGLLSLRSQRRREPVRVRLEEQTGQRSRQERRAGLQVGVGGAGGGRHRADRGAEALRSENAPDEDTQRPRGGGSAAGTAALREGGSQAGSQLRHLAHRQARGDGSVGRDLHRAFRQRRHPEPDADAGGGGAGSRVVARREVGGLLLGGVGRIQPRNP